ncbi:MAG TPA: Fe-S-containing protein [Thermoanaerobaculia bacterium]|nr:Fe-S-containing protein [Thermoanaerobaculia bacterium]
MFEALIVALREGVEAALVVAIIVAFLRREGFSRFLGSVWSGIAAAVAASLAVSYLLYRLTVNENVLEGILYLASAGVVSSMMIWMWRHSQALSGEMKGSLARIVGRERAASVAAGIFAFTFLMVFREGVETVLFLSALSLTTSGLLTLLGVLLGLAAAVAFGILFVRGSLRVDLGRFFKITGIALLIFVVQLLINGYHELAEAGWLPANAGSMAAVGPLVKNEFFFVAAVLVLPLLLLLVPGRSAPKAPEEGGASGPAASAPTADSPAAARLARAQAGRMARARVLGGSLGVAILAVLGLGFVYTRPPAVLSPATLLAAGADGVLRIPRGAFHGTALARFTVDLGGIQVRFIAVPLGEGGAAPIVTAFDACEICGAKGYYQEGGSVTCMHCGSTIYPPSIGQRGGCNPIPLPSRLEAGSLVLKAADLAAGRELFSAAARSRRPGM